MYYSDERNELSAKIEAAENESTRLCGEDTPSNRERHLKVIREKMDLEAAIDCLAPRFEVGDGISCHGYSDVAPYTVIDVSSSGKRITVRSCNAELDPTWKPECQIGGFSAHTVNNDSQRWNITEDESENARVITLSLRKSKVNNPHVSHRESWRQVGESTQGGSRWYEGRTKFYDYNF